MRVEKLEIRDPDNFESFIENIPVVEDSEVEVPVLFQESKYEYYFKIKELDNFTFIKELKVFAKGLVFFFNDCTKTEEVGKFKCESLANPKAVGYWKVNAGEISSNKAISERESFKVF